MHHPLTAQQSHISVPPQASNICFSFICYYLFHLFILKPHVMALQSKADSLHYPLNK